MRLPKSNSVISFYAVGFYAQTSVGLPEPTLTSATGRLTSVVIKKVRSKLVGGPSGCAPAEIVGSNLTGRVDVSLLCCVLSGLCDELITRPEESYRLWCVVVCNLENLINEEALAH